MLSKMRGALRQLPDLGLTTTTVDSESLRSHVNQVRHYPRNAERNERHFFIR